MFDFQVHIGDEYMTEIPDDAKKLIEKRNELAELYNSVHDQSNKYLIGERIREIESDLLEVYGLL
ncbi:MAG TPA: hypothetical protein DCG34_01060 [Clostridiales bacterium]|nr:hypothetical protein [Clostridiales bacterium]